MPLILTHAGHSHGPDLSLVALLAIGLVLGGWIAVTAVRSWRGSRSSGSGQAGSGAGRTGPAPPHSADRG